MESKHLLRERDKSIFTAASGVFKDTTAIVPKKLSASSEEDNYNAS